MADNGALLEELKEIMGVTKGIDRIVRGYPTPGAICERISDPSMDVVSKAVVSLFAGISWDAIADYASLSLISEDDLSELCSAHTESTTAFRLKWRDVIRRHNLPEGVDRGTFMHAVRYAPDSRVMTRTVRLAKQMLAEAGGGVRASLARNPSVMHSIFTGDGGVEDGDGQGDTEKARAYTDKGKQTTKEYMSPEMAGTGEKVMTAPAFADTKSQKDTRAAALSRINDLIGQMTKASAAVGKHPEEMFGMRWRDVHREKTRFS